MKYAAFLVFALLFTVGAAAQELECTVTINTDLLTAEARENLNNFAEQVQTYINSYRWTEEDLGGEKIAFTVSISFQGSPSPNRYTAQAYIGSSRKIFGLDKNTALLRVIDENWEFLYQPNSQILHDETVFDPLASFLDFYCYLVIGLDFESYEPRAGIPYLEQAMNVVNVASSGGKGWQIGSPTEYSRGEYIDEVLSPKYEPVRMAIYRYHYFGLDRLYFSEEKAKKSMLSALKSIGNVMTQTNQASQFVKIFFDAKYLEIAETFRGYPDTEVWETLMQIDPGHRQTYDDARSRN
jgi:hypothetical protein